MAAQDPIYLRENHYSSGIANIPTSIMPELRFRDITPLEDIATMTKNDLSQINFKPNHHVHLRDSTKGFLKELEEFSTKFMTKD